MMLIFSKFYRFNVIVILSSLFSLAAFAENQSDEPAEIRVDLPRIVKEGTPGDVLLEDAIVSSPVHQTPWNSGSGSIQNSLQNQMALPMTDYGRSGNMSQLRGLGVTAEDVDVQAFGISLSPPQGGGANLSDFPQFLWSEFRYQSGPSLNALNQTASTGTLSLTPWTARALVQSDPGGRASGFSSSQGLTQVSAAARNGYGEGQATAVLGGYSYGTSNGPSGGLSTRFGKGRVVGTVHLLVSDLETQVPGPINYPSPNARSRNQRVIPVVQGDFKLTRASLLKTSFFYDSAKIDYLDPDQGSSSNSRIQQWGIQNAFFWEDWKFGLSARQVSYSNLSSFQSGQPSFAPLQNIGNLQFSRMIELRTIRVEPTVQGVWVTGFGLLPQGSLGVRKEWGQGHEALYSRVSFSQRIPSLLDRYYRYTDFVGNPNLRTERDWTGILGGEVKSGRAAASVQAYAQYRQDARVPLGMTVTNLGDAAVVAVTGTGQFKVFKFLDISNSMTLSKSRLFATETQFPYVPVFLNVAGVTVHSRPTSVNWEWVTSFRLEGARVFNVSTGEQLPSYGVFDTGVSVRLWQATVAARCENVLDRPIELIQGYPLGRVFSLAVSAEL